MYQAAYSQTPLFIFFVWIFTLAVKMPTIHIGVLGVCASALASHSILLVMRALGSSSHGSVGSITHRGNRKSSQLLVSSWSIPSHGRHLEVWTSQQEFFSLCLSYSPSTSQINKFKSKEKFLILLSSHSHITTFYFKTFPLISKVEWQNKRERRERQNQREREREEGIWREKNFPSADSLLRGPQQLDRVNQTGARTPPVSSMWVTGTQVVGPWCAAF